MLALIYRSFIHGRAANVQHIYFTLCGLGLCYFNFGKNMQGSRFGWTGGPDPPPWKITVAIVYIGFLRNSGADSPREAIGSNRFLREVCTALCGMHCGLKKKKGPQTPLDGIFKKTQHA